LEKIDSNYIETFKEENNMQKEIIEIKAFIYILFLSVICMACNSDIEKYSLICDKSVSSIVDDKFMYDSMFVSVYNADSIIISRYLGSEGFSLKSKFIKENGNFYELRLGPQIVEEGKENDTYITHIITFSLKDTVFEYCPKDDYTSIFVFNLGYDRCKYEIKKQNDNEYITIKQSLIDTTYREIYFYDRNYILTKYINTWRENKCVYLKHLNSSD
jgi:hypothetical protein